MIDEKKLIEKIKERIEMHKKDYQAFKNYSGDRKIKDIAKRDECTVIIDLIKSQPKVGEWIPVSVNKPQRQDSKNTIIEFYFVSTKRGNVRLGFRDEDGEWLTEHGNIISNVIAWMPLPPAYKE